MRVLTKEEFEMQRISFYEQIRKGSVFIYPTDTIYGIGCDAENSEAVKKIRELKNRENAPFSVIAPSKQWIRENCFIDEKAEEWIEKLPAPLTLILKLKKETGIAKEVNNGLQTLGVRMPQHWFLDHVMELGIPFITTSVNKRGEEFMTSLRNLDGSIKKSISFAIYEGKKNGSPSSIVNLADTFKIVER